MLGLGCPTSKSPCTVLKHLRTVVLGLGCPTSKSPCTVIKHLRTVVLGLGCPTSKSPCTVIKHLRRGNLRCHPLKAVSMALRLGTLPVLPSDVCLDSSASATPSPCAQHALRALRTLPTSGLLGGSVKLVCTSECPL